MIEICVFYFIYNSYFMSHDITTIYCNLVLTSYTNNMILCGNDKYIAQLSWLLFKNNIMMANNNLSFS